MNVFVYCICSIYPLTTSIPLVTQNLTVTAALDGCAVGLSGKEGDDEMVEAAMRQTESSQASMVARCTAMLKALE